MIPRVIMHIGASLDGRIDWGVLPESPYYAVIRSFQADLDLSGTGTMLAAEPPGDPRAVYGEMYDQWVSDPARPLLAVVDSRGLIRNWHLLKKQAWWRGHIALCSAATPKQHLSYLEEQGTEFIIAGDEKVDLRAALEELNARFGVRVIRTDCGGTLNGILLRAGLVSEISAIVNPTLVGGMSPRSFYVAPDLAAESGVVLLKLMQMERMNDDFVWLRYEICGAPASLNELKSANAAPHV